MIMETNRQDGLVSNVTTGLETHLVFHPVNIFFNIYCWWSAYIGARVS